MSNFALSSLHAAVNKLAFDCGSELLNRYIREQASQDSRRRISACFIATKISTSEASAEPVLVGYYTLASASILLDDLPAATVKKLPRYPSVPSIRLGRLAVDRRYTGQGLGGALLADALMRALRAEIAAYAVVVDAKDDTAAAFYAHHGFIALPDTPRSLFLPLASVKPLNGRE
jgi:ribosomal protein S18 acetylase RimI-like enzyme